MQITKCTHFLVGLILVSIVGCAETPTAQNAKSDQNSNQSSLSVDRTVDEKLALTGNTVYLYIVDDGLSKILNREHIKELRQRLKSYVEKRGFIVADKYAKGYSTLYVAGDEYHPGAQLDAETQKFLKDTGFGRVTGGQVTTETTETKIVDGQVVTKKTTTASTILHRLSVQWDINSYGKRPKKWFTLTFSSEKSLDSSWAELSKTVTESLDGFRISPPSENIVGQGEPGCLPRFGYDETRVLDDGRYLFKVTRVQSGSPAQKAGIRVGDIIEAVDSMPYSDWHSSEPAEVYEKRVSVPIKFSRNGETIRSTIRAQIVCD